MQIQTILFPYKLCVTNENKLKFPLYNWFFLLIPVNKIPLNTALIRLLVTLSLVMRVKLYKINLGEFSTSA